LKRVKDHACGAVLDRSAGECFRRYQPGIVGLCPNFLHRVPQAKKPIEKFREGPFHVSIWENEGINGAFRTASFQIRFKKGDDWQSGTSYGLSELAHLEIAAKQARTRI
jgi:hypothetical protein